MPTRPTGRPFSAGKFPHALSRAPRPEGVER